MSLRVSSIPLASAFRDSSSSAKSRSEGYRNSTFRGRLINEIDRKSVEEFKAWRAGQNRKNAKSKVSGATVNRNLTTLKRIFNYADAMGLNVRNPVRHVPYFTETGRIRALTIEEVDKYLAAAKGDLRDFAILATETGGRPNEILALHKDEVHLAEGYVSLPGTKNRRAHRDVPSTDDAKEVLERRMAKSPNGYIFRFGVPRPSTMRYCTLPLSRRRMS